MKFTSQKYGGGLWDFAGAGSVDFALGFSGFSKKLPRLLGQV